ncbi:MAG: TonB-dependent receptor, partial [Bacteroidales bacterium]|nr:TonB-dependent receptor [Bacteroidales bacterium]
MDEITKIFATSNNVRMKIHLTLVFTFFVVCLNGQALITGKVSDSKDQPLTGVNIYFEGTYEGTSSDTSGYYSLETNLSGTVTMVFSFIGFETANREIQLNKNNQELNIILSESAGSLDEIVITAGAFEASDEKKSVVLRPLDIVTTAGGLADIPGAINTLPGTHTVGEEGKLFVRGGDSYETRTFIDGMIVDKPYSSSMPDIPSRGRFSPFLFKGTIFSSGGYSAEYGQALSSALILQTTDLPRESVTSLSFMSVGLGASHTKRWDKTSISLSADYYNLAPYYAAFKQEREWLDPPNGAGGSVNFRHKTGENGMLKIYSSGSKGFSKMKHPNMFDVSDQNNLSLTNSNYYINSTYKDIIGEKWISNTGISFSGDSDVTFINSDKIEENSNSYQVKQKFSWLVSEKQKIIFGGDIWRRDYDTQYKIVTDSANYSANHNDNVSALFAETEIKPRKRAAIRLGIRSEYSSLIQRFNIAPRISLAIKTGLKSQVSMAYGRFLQSPEYIYLQFNSNLQYESGQHFILNYQFQKNNRIFRIEGYYKDYKNLVTYDSLYKVKPKSYQNDGNGYARGIDIFWRDRSIGNHDYWISYSWIDTKRHYHDFPTSATPTFVSNHNLSIVYKYFVPKITTQIGVTYKHASGRTYINPNNNTYLGDKT